MIPTKSDSLYPGLLIGLCLLHAILATLLWVLVFKFGVEMISGKLWAGMTTVWLLWLLFIAFSPRKHLKMWILAVVASSLILAPTYSTLYTFLVWTIEGFAP
jgi:hypothetical protein